MTIQSAPIGRAPEKTQMLYLLCFQIEIKRNFIEL